MAEKCKTCSGCVWLRETGPGAFLGQSKQYACVVNPPVPIVAQNRLGAAYPVVTDETAACRMYALPMECPPFPDYLDDSA